MSSGGGSPIDVNNFVDTLSSGINNLGESISTGAKGFANNATDFLGNAVNVALQYQTSGLLGYDPSTGKFGSGVTGRVVEDIGKEVMRGLDESIGEITGRNVAREQLNLQREQLAEERQNAADLQKADKKRRTANDTSASQAAARARVRNPQLAKATVGQDVLGNQQDFLGL